MSRFGVPAAGPLGVPVGSSPRRQDGRGPAPTPTTHVLNRGVQDVAGRVTWAAADRLAGRLGERDWAIVRSLAAARVLTGDQLTRLHFFDLAPGSRDRVRRRVLARLTEWQVVSRLGRVVGGVRAGSLGWTYALGPAGQRLAQLGEPGQRTVRIRRPWTPGRLFLGHSLGVAEVFVRLMERSRTAAAITVASFVTEPACWWPNGLGGFIKPDALIVLSTPNHDELVWLEVDQGTESLPTITRKLRDYVDFVERGQLGPRDTVPHVVVTVPDEARQANIQGVTNRLQVGDLCSVVAFEAAPQAIMNLALEAVK